MSTKIETYKKLCTVKPWFQRLRPVIGGRPKVYRTHRKVELFTTGGGVYTEAKPVIQAGTIQFVTL